MKKLILTAAIVATAMTAAAASFADTVFIKNEGWYVADINFTSGDYSTRVGDLLTGQYWSVDIPDGSDWEVTAWINGSPLKDTYLQESGTGSVDLELHGTVFKPTLIPAR